MTLRFSVVIPCYNERDYIAAAINSLHAQTFDGGYEVIVVDNNCTDDTAEIAGRLGARVVAEASPGVCNARQRGTQASRGEIVISADADTTYPPNWLDKIDRSFRSNDYVVAVGGPCRYRDGPWWGRVYGRLLFGCLQLIYRLTGRVCYVTATNFAFRRNQWPGYDVNLTQGGDELDLLGKLRKRGKVMYNQANVVWTSPRRLTRGVLYNLFITLIAFYLLGYLVNRAFGRRLIGSAPPFRADVRRSRRIVRVVAVGVGVVAGILMMMPSTEISQLAVAARHSLFAQLPLLSDGSGQSR